MGRFRRRAASAKPGLPNRLPWCAPSRESPALRPPCPRCAVQTSAGVGSKPGQVWRPVRVIAGHFCWRWCGHVWRHRIRQVKPATTQTFGFFNPPSCVITQLARAARSIQLGGKQDPFDDLVEALVVELRALSNPSNHALRIAGPAFCGGGLHSFPYFCVLAYSYLANRLLFSIESL